jgi:hypothetical protein
MEVTKDIGTYIGPFVLDVWHKIFTYCDAIVLANLCQCCRGFRRTIAGDAYLTQVMYWRVHWVANNIELSRIVFGSLTPPGVTKLIRDYSAYEIAANSLYVAYQFTAKYFFYQQADATSYECKFPCFERAFSDGQINDAGTDRCTQWIWKKYLYRLYTFEPGLTFTFWFHSGARLLEERFPDVFRMKTLMFRAKKEGSEYCLCAHNECEDETKLCRHDGTPLVLLRVRMYPPVKNKGVVYHHPYEKESAFAAMMKEDPADFLSLKHRMTFMDAHRENIYTSHIWDDE